MPYLIVALIIAILALIFGLQNPTEVTIHFFWWKMKGSLALVLLFSFAFGVIASLLASFPRFIRKNRLIKKLNRQLKEQPPPPESKSDSGKEFDDV